MSKLYTVTLRGLGTLTHELFMSVVMQRFPPQDCKREDSIGYQTEALV